MYFIKYRDDCGREHTTPVLATVNNRYGETVYVTETASGLRFVLQNEGSLVWRVVGYA